MRRYSAGALLLIVLGLAASAQRWPGPVYPESDPNAFKISTQANLEEALTRIERLKAQLAQTKDEEERTFILNRILELCQSQLNEDSNDSGVIVVERKGRDERGNELAVRWQGAFSAIEDEIRGLGEEGLQLYEKAYGPRAALLLQQAAETRQRERIQYLNRRFGLTRAGLRAGALLATMWWEEGEVSRAARSLERVLSLTELLSPDEQARYSAWLAHCYRDLGERANLVKLIEQTVVLREREVDEGGEKVKLGELLQKRLLEARDATLDTIDALGVEWPGGNYSNTGLHEKPSDYRQIAWAKKLPGLQATPVWNRFMGYPTPHVPPFLPMFDGNMFYVNTGDRLAAYDLIAAEGDTPSWTCKPFDTTPSNWRLAEADPNMILPISAWHGTLFTAIENPLHNTYHDPNPDPNFRLYSHYPKVRRALCAVDSSTGRLLWKLGGQYEGDKDQQTNFLSAVVHEGTLYAIASRVPEFAEIFLYAINPDDGEILWNLRLCYGQQETTMFGRPAREPHPSLPCIAGGTMYLCTNIGGVVAVELATRSLRWISRYDYMPRPVTKYTETYYRDVTWYNSPTIYTEHKGKPYILAAPTDARMLFALDARTGSVLWQLDQSEQPLYGGRSLVGVREGKAYVAGDGGIRGGGASRLHVIDLENPRQVQSVKVTPADSGNLLALAGRPSIAANRLLWPGVEGGSSCTLAEVDLDRLRTVSSAYVPGTYANLGYSVFAQHGVVFTVSGNDYTRGISQLAARFNTNALVEAARNEYQAAPDDPQAAMRYGLLTMRVGDRNEAIKALKLAFELASRPPADTRVRDQAGRALVASFLELADKAHAARKYTEALGHVQNAREYAIGRSQLSDCFSREERALLAEGREADIETFYRDVISREPDFGMGADPEIPVGLYCRIRLAERLERAGKSADAAVLWQEVQQAPARYSFGGLSLRALALERLRDVIKRAGREVYAPQDAAAAELLKTGTAESWAKLLQLYPLALAADEAALNLANEKLKAHLGAEAADVLRGALDENSDRPRAAEMNALLALAYKAAGERLRARLLALRLLRENPKAELKLGGTVKSFEELLRPLTEGDASEMAGEALPQLPKQISELWSRPWAIGGFTRMPPQPVNLPEARFHLSETSMTGTELLALDAGNGEPRWARKVPVSLNAVYRTPRGILFVQGQGFALYDDDGNEQWSTPAGATPIATSLLGGMLVYATRFTLSGQAMVRVTARDVDSGGVVWEQTMAGASVRWIAQSNHGVLVMPQGNETELVLLDAETGRETARTALDPHGRITVQPVLLDDRLLVINRDGKVLALRGDTLKPAGEFETRIRYATQFTIIEGDLLVVGLTSAGRFGAADGKVIWRRDYAGNEVVTAQVLLKDSIALATRAPNGAGRISGFSLTDGKPTFSYDIKRENDSDRVDVQNSAPFDGGLVMAFAENRIIDGRMQLWGFRLLVLNSDGTERFTWTRQAPDSPLFVQLALTENYIALTCDKTTFGFGRKD